MSPRSLCVAAIAACVCIPAANAQTFDFTINTQASTAAWSLSVTAPFATGGSSFILGDYDATSNPTGTRTIPGLFGGDVNANTPVNITNGGASADAGSGGTPLHPAGSFRLALDTETNTCTLSNFSADMLNGGSAGAGAEVSITYSSFRTRQPTCLIIGGIPITVPLGEAQVTQLDAMQNGVAGGIIVPGPPGVYAFAVPVEVTLTVAAELNGLPLEVPVQTVLLALAGNIQIVGETASITTTVVFEQDITEPGPVALDPIAFTEPLCSGNLVLNLSLAELSVGFGVDASIIAGGIPAPVSCDPDVNCDGSPDQGDVACMIFAVAGDLACICQDPDFNLDGSADQGDVASLIGVVAGQPCP